ncbi:MATE family efflux transporter [bacterium]|nr:MATE family efflux transporter [bacterium]
MNIFKRRWSCDGGYSTVLKIAIPLILSTGAYSVQHFIDRMFLSWYSAEAVAAAMPASILSFTILCFFIGTASFVSTFVAQYYGARQYDYIGRIVWQGIYFSLTTMVVMLLVIPFSDRIFALAGHPPEVQVLESRYFFIICLGGFFPVASSAISGLFSGLGRTWTVMWVNFAATGVNIILNYGMIFGHFGFPEWGIQGAAIATVISSVIATLLFLVLMLTPAYRMRYGTWRGRLFNQNLFRDLLRFGVPSGIQFFLDMLGFTLFILLVGRIGTIELAATNIAFNISMLCFMPMVGLGIAISVLVGQNLGDNNPGMAEFSTWSGTHISFCYMTSVAFLFVVFPGFFLTPFGYDADPESFKPIFDYGVVLLRFVALYTLFDTMNITFSSALKGAGDTLFVMKVIVLVSWLVMVIPCYLAIVIFNQHLFVAWGFATAYVVSLAFVFLTRFLKGSWKTMRVIRY